MPLGEWRARRPILSHSNADSCLIEFENGRRALFDFADMRDPDDPYDLRCDLEKELRDCLDGAKAIDVVAFTHLDTDHCARAKEVFHLEYAEKYQGGNRIKINTMWVPATAILEEGVKGQARTLRAEARHRFLDSKGIRVFGRQEKLDQFLIDRNIDPNQRRNLISDAGTLCPEFNLDKDGVEFFVHSPFAETCGDTVEYRNGSAIFMQAVFLVGGRTTKMILSADVPHEVIDDIVRITRYHKYDHRLEWDINNIPHHCSYLSLSDTKGKDKTAPVERLEWVYKKQGQAGGLLVSTSKPIPTDDADKQPPHRQVANYYKEVASDLGGEWIVTGLIGSGNPLVRSLVNHLGPWIGGSDLMQENSTRRMSQVALGYRDSPLSANHVHGGGLLAGDRVPDVMVRHFSKGTWTTAELQNLLDPSRFVLLAVQGSGRATLQPALQRAIAPFGDMITLMQVAPPEVADVRQGFETAFGRSSCAFLVRPDGYVGMAAGG